MTRLRWLLLIGTLVISLSLAFFLRDVVYDVVVVPIAYLLWLGKYYYTAIPQIILWMILLAILFLTAALNFVPEAQPSKRKEHIHKPAEGQVEALAVWIHKARKGSYFKWQLANRLGRIARRLNELTGQQAKTSSNKEGVEKYLDAGLNNSFVDFATPKNRFRHSRPTPLELDPKEVVDYLESQMELRSDRHS